jgi:oxygen-dependent protoporphyrinogen oxidase
VTRHVPALVVGGGISGLVCAYALRDAGIETEIFEASLRPGGVIQSITSEGFLLELGPQSFGATPSLHKLCQQLGIRNQLLTAPPLPRFILIDGKLKAAPLRVFPFFASSFVGIRTKCSILQDAFGRTVPPAGDESVAAFVRRKFTPELLEKIVGPFVSGIYAGDPEKLSLGAAFPQLREAETETGSIVRGLARRGKQLKQSGAPRPALLSFRNGNETLVHALSSKIGPALQTNARVTSIARNIDASADVQIETNGHAETISTKKLIIATPTEIAGKLLGGLDPAFNSLLKSVEYVPVAVVSLGYRKSDIGHSLHGFGFLVPRSAGLRVLGTVWNSSLFPGRAPDGHALLTSFLGGATNPEVAGLPPGELATLVHNEISPLLSITGDPAFSGVTIWRRALPQYNLGHLDRLAAVAKLLRNHSGIWLAGNYLRGPALGSTVEQSLAVAEEVRVTLQS